jgi:hypothetical protein
VASGPATLSKVGGADGTGRWAQVKRLRGADMWARPVQKFQILAKF